jgi:hypothetical protein
MNDIMAEKSVLLILITLRTMYLVQHFYCMVYYVVYIQFGNTPAIHSEGL